MNLLTDNRGTYELTNRSVQSYDLGDELINMSVRSHGLEDKLTNRSV
jgi:hypothetical protein